MNTAANVSSPKKKNNKLAIFVIAVMTCVFFFQRESLPTGNAVAAPAAEPTPQQSAARARVKAAHDDTYKVRRMIRESQRDPSSFELTAVSWHPNADALCFTYRSKNGFGALTVSRAIYGRATGKLVYSENLKGFADMWKLGCSDADKIAFNV